MIIKQKSTTTEKVNSRLRHRYLLAAFCVISASAFGNAARADTLVYRQDLGSRPTVGTIDFYSYSTGNSGYYRIRNTTNANLRYRIRIFLKNGKSTTRYVPVDSGRTSSGSSFSYAGFNRSGVSKVELLHARRK